MKSLKLIVLATVLAVSPACSNKKDSENKAPPVADNTGSAAMGSGSAGSAADMAGSAGSAGDMAGSAGSAGSADMAGSAGSAAAPDPKADYIDVYAEHAEKKPDDPVAVHFDRFKVVKASFDPKKVEGGSATLELDLTSMKSGSDKRDKHLASPDYLDTGKFTTLTIDIGNVKKKADNTYTADAKVKLRDVEKKYPVTFEVVETGEDWIRVKGEHKFARLDFKVGGKPSKDESVAQELTVKLQLTLKKT